MNTDNESFLVVTTNNITQFRDKLYLGNLNYDFKSPYRSYKREYLSDHAVCYGKYSLWITPLIIKCNEFIRSKK